MPTLMETMSTLTPAQLRSELASFITDPYPTYRQLRDQTPLNHMVLPGGIVPGIEEPLLGWALMKYDDVYGALRDHDTFSSARNPLVEKACFRGSYSLWTTH